MLAHLRCTCYATVVVYCWDNTSCEGNSVLCADRSQMGAALWRHGGTIQWGCYIEHAAQPCRPTQAFPDCSSVCTYTCSHSQM